MRVSRFFSASLPALLLALATGAFSACTETPSYLPPCVDPDHPCSADDASADAARADAAADSAPDSALDAAPSAAPDASDDR